ncbi:MAG: ATP-binding protein [Deltaproteobacteria bacterium]|nr:ATP-binding protein [Deltaproteobacteria bacterium]
MSKLAWTPWHKVLQIRDDLKSGELSLAVFAADLYDVLMGKARPVYQKPREFFALTYPTFNLRELARDVIVRLAGKSDKAIRQLELTYGGGKTHALITLFHLVSDPKTLPDLPAVKEFVEHIGIPLPRARVAVLAFDKLDVEKGMEVRGPKGATRWLKHPWSVLAFQIAGAKGLKLLHAEGGDAERDSAPAENLLVELLALPAKEGLSTLILIDEVLMYAREKIGLDPAWRGRLVNFFQYLTQAVTKVDRCAVVASLLATDPGKSDTLGKELTQELYAIFRREREQSVQPILKEDVAEVLRRRFFTPESARDREAFRPHVVAALKGIVDFDEQTRKNGKTAEDRFLQSYPFHPDLTEVFYTKWTNLEGFQRTRGVLRTFALALRDAEQWDQCPLVGANVFLGEPGKESLAEAARELTTVAATEEYEGKRQEWTAILEGELAKAREIQQETAGLKFREVEQAVFATFLHSQPISQKAVTRDLLVLLGHTRPDKIELEKGLQQWTEVSWFLDEAGMRDAETGTDRQRGGTQQSSSLPKSWRLGSKPNLRQMHHDACVHVPPELVESKLLDEIGKLKNLTAGASAAGARVHNLPARPRDIEDDGEFHYAVLGPSAASDSGKPSAEARRFIEETTTPDRPRVYRNAVVLAVPSRDGLEAARTRLREYLGWEEVRSQLKDQEIDPIRSETLSASLEDTRKKIPEAIQQAYCIVVTVSEKNEVQAFKITVGGEPLFGTIKAESRARIRETAISADALLPGGPYDLWREGETSRRVKDLVGALAQFPHLPKMLNRSAILDTLVGGCREGLFVLRLARPDRSLRTWWRETPAENVLKDPALEVGLPEKATLTELSPPLLAPGVLPGLWETPEITLADLCAYFSGARVVKSQREGYEEPVTIPQAERAVVEAAVHSAVRDGKLWLTSGPASILAEEIPAGLLTDDARLQAPPQPILTTEVLPESLPEAWSGETTTALSLSLALSKRAGKTLPWITVREVLNGTFRARLLERTPDSGGWPCDFAGVGNVKLRIPSEELLPKVAERLVAKPGVLVAEADLRPNEIQDLADQVAAIAKAAVGLDLKFRLRVELGGGSRPSDEVVASINQLLQEISSNLRLR